MEPHEALMTWATDEMKFRDSNGYFVLPSNHDFQRLFKPPLSEVWLYVVKHVKAVQNVKRIQGNLMVQKHLALKKELDGGDQPENEENSLTLSQLVHEKKRLLSELATCEAEVAMMEGEMEHTKVDLTAIELEYQKSIQQIRDLQKKDSLLRIVQECGAESVDRYTEYGRRVIQRAEEVVTRRSNTAETTYSKGKDEEIETKCCRDVRLSCEACSQFLKQALNGKFADKQALEATKKEVSKKVEVLCSLHTAGSLVTALTINTLTAASMTRDQTVGININQDVTDLSFSLKSDGLKDLSNPPTVQESVRQLLQESNVEHIMRWFKEQEHKNESWKLEARLDSLLTEIKKLVHRLFGEHADNLALAKRYVNSLITLAIERSVVPCLKEVIENLEKRREKAKHEREELKKKFECIQNFRSLVNKKQSIIELLAKQNSGAPERLNDQRKQVLKFISERSISSHQTEVESFSCSLMNSLTLEVEQFSRILLSSLLTVTLDSTTRQCVLDLSLSPSLYPAVCKKAKLYRDISSSLGFPSFKSIDCLLHHVMDIHHEINTLQWKEQMRKSYIQSAQETAQTTDDISAIVEITKIKTTALCEEVKVHDERQQSNLVPQLEGCIKTANKHVQEANKVKQQVAAWWNQPAQYLTPWVVTDGLTFEQWMQKWRCAVAQVHKKMMTPQKKK